MTEKSHERGMSCVQCARGGSPLVRSPDLMLHELLSLFVQRLFRAACGSAVRARRWTAGRATTPLRTSSRSSLSSVQFFF